MRKGIKKISEDHYNKVGKQKTILQEHVFDRVESRRMLKRDKKGYTYLYRPYIEVKWELVKTFGPSEEDKAKAEFMGAWD